MTKYKNPAEDRKAESAIENISLISSLEQQKEVFDFITQSFYADPKSVNELEASVLLASDNSSATPGADRWFIKGAFALLKFLSRGEKEVSG